MSDDAIPPLLGAAPLVPPDNVEISTAAEFAAWWNEQTPDHREEAFARIREWSKRSSDCFIRNHDAALDRLAALEREHGALLARLHSEGNVSRETLRDPDELDPALVPLGTMVIATPRDPSPYREAYRAPFVTYDVEHDAIVLDLGDPEWSVRLHRPLYRLTKDPGS